MNQKRITALLCWCILLMFSAGSALAGVDKVRCILWQGDVGKFHTALESAGADRLKGVITTTNTTSIWYQWVFGDGSQSAVTQLSGSTKYNVEIEHEYTGAVGTPFTALLLVSDVDGSMADAVSDRYLIKIEEDTLDYRVNRVIDEGLWYLYKNQLTTSYVQSTNGLPVTAWSSYSNYYPSATGAAIQAFEINNHKATGNFNEDPYAEVVAAGLNWLLTGTYYGTSVMTPLTLTAASSPFGVSDVNANGIGVQVSYPGDAPYQGGIVMDAIISSGTPGADSGRDFDGDGSNDSFQEVIQDMVDAYAWGQGDYVGTGTYVGAYNGWAYSWNTNTTDNSANQWAVIGLIPAEKDFGCTVPQFVKDRLNESLTYTYNPTQRYYGYRDSTTLVSNSAGVTRPSGMVQMIFAVPGYESDVRWTGPESWFADNFNSAFSTSQRSYYGWLSFVKSMLLSGNELLSNGFNWYRGSDSLKGLAQRLVDEHESDGSWPQGSQVTYPGSYGDVFVTSWAIQMLKPALFQAAPIACFTASPNPTYADRDIAFDPGCTDHSDSAKDISNIVSFEWDWDNDGVYDTSSAGPDIQTHAFTCASLPCAYPVVLRVIDDDGIPATFSMNIDITNPPHPPEADAGGPYIVSLCDTDSLLLDGSKSIEPNEGDHEDGCATCENDTITAWDWDLQAPLNDFTNATGETVSLDSASVDNLFDAGTQYTIGLRVTDNTEKAYPGSNSPDLTDVDFATVDVFAGCACDLSVTLECASLQYKSVVLKWTQGGSYAVLRSEAGPNSGFKKISDADAESSYEDITAVFNTRYWYRLQGDDCLSTAVMIDYVEDTCGGGELPQCIDDMTAIAKSRKVQLEWACHQDADGYNVYRSTSPNVGLVEANKIADGYTSIYCAYTDRSVTDGTTYFYKITKVIGGQEICMSNEVSATPVAVSRIR